MKWCLCHGKGTLHYMERIYTHEHTGKKCNYEKKNLYVFTLPNIRKKNEMLNLLSNALIFVVKLYKYREILKTIDPDIVHVHYINEAALFARLVCRKPFVVTAWGSDILIGPKKHHYQRLIVKKVLNNSDLITCDADHMKVALKEFGADNEKINIIYFGTDIKKYHPKKYQKNLRKILGTYGKHTIISTRNLDCPLF